MQDAFSQTDAAVRQALEPVIEKLRIEFGGRVRETSLARLCGDERAADPMSWVTIYRVLQGTEMQSCLGAWIADAKPAFGPAPTAGWGFVNQLDRTRIGEAVQLRELFCRRLNAALSSGDLLCIPSSPTIAPLKGSTAYDRNCDYYRRTLALTAIAGVGRLPQISMPLAQVNGAPVGLSLLAAHGADPLVLEVAKTIEEPV